MLDFAMGIRFALATRWTNINVHDIEKIILGERIQRGREIFLRPSRISQAHWLNPFQWRNRIALLRRKQSPVTSRESSLAPHKHSAAAGETDQETEGDTTVKRTRLSKMGKKMPKRLLGEGVVYMTALATLLRDSNISIATPAEGGPSVSKASKRLRSDNSPERKRKIKG
ncbi:hypothetical protein JTB14_012671 [Gonioctena quinquepunctata]|nr:hypothetical protein JTB14_012671 [Gonioctena quinquepunctata]